MLDQTIKTSNLLKLITTSDLIKYSLGKNKDEIFATVNSACAKIGNPNFTISPLKKKLSFENNVYTPSCIEDILALQKVNDNLKKIYKFKQADRHLIIRQVIELLKETTPMSIIKLDIKSFYKSINKNVAVDKVMTDNILNYKSKKVIKSLFNLEEISNSEGLPRGINISASLSEIYMRDFDTKVRQLSGIYYYARYVDDILIFCNCDPHKLKDKIEILLYNETRLELNGKKGIILERVACHCKPTCSCTGQCKCYYRCKCVQTKQALTFEYLGYKFSFSDLALNNKDLQITLASKKIKKIKSRLINSFLDYIKNKKFDLLEKRIALMTGNYIINSNGLGKLKSGIFYNYPFINDETCLDELTGFLRKAVNAKNGSFGTKIRATLTPCQRRIITKYSFKTGYKNKKHRDLKKGELKELRKCWMYE